MENSLCQCFQNKWVCRVCNKSKHNSGDPPPVTSWRAGITLLAYLEKCHILQITVLIFAHPTLTWSASVLASVFFLQNATNRWLNMQFFFFVDLFWLFCFLRERLFRPLYLCFVYFFRSVSLNRPSFYFVNWRSCSYKFLASFIHPHPPLFQLVAQF